MKDFTKMDENEKIMYTIKDMGARSFETAVSMEQIIEHAIQIGLTEDYQTDNWEGFRNGDHPWWTKVAPMMGIGTVESVMENEEIHLHRQKVKRTEGRKSNVMVYWFDPEKEHEIVKSNKKSAAHKNVKKIAPQSSEIKRKFTDSEMQQKATANPDLYVVINGKLYSKPWVQAHPEKFGVLAQAIK